MEIILKQLIPQEFCLKCEGCCRFIEEKSEWIPRITQMEILELAKENIPPAVFSKTDKDDRQLNLVKSKGINFCIFLSPKENKCEIYKNRPFDCRLYPFILEKKGKNISLGIHLACTFAKENLDKKELKEYVKYLKEFLNIREVAAFIKENSFLAGNYQDYKNQIKTICILQSKAAK
jgi:Fe-S-cluster containining protein